VDDVTNLPAVMLEDSRDQNGDQNKENRDQYLLKRVQENCLVVPGPMKENVFIKISYEGSPV